MDQAIALLAVSQLGLVTRKQLLAHGLGRRVMRNRIEKGHIQPIHPGVYRVGEDPPPLSFEQRLKAALLAAGVAAVSHRAAGALFGFEGVETDLPEITVAHDRRVKLEGVVVHRTRVFGPRDVCDIGPFRVTTPTRTLIDLTDLIKMPALEKAMDDAIRRGLTNLPDLRTAIERRGKRGVDNIVAVRALVLYKDGTFHRQWAADRR